MSPEDAFQEIPIMYVFLFLASAPMPLTSSRIHSDLTDLGSPDPGARQELVERVKDACTRVGFFYVKKHGIPPAVFARTIAAMRAFFDLPLDEKLEIENKKSPNFKGYSPVLSGNNDPNGGGDLQEGFEFGYELPDVVDDGGASSQASRPLQPTPQDVMSAPNVWPASLPEFRLAALEYYHHALQLGRQLFPLFALALNLPADFFADKTKHSAALMRLLHYPPQIGEVDGRVIGIGAHTDWECFTILYQQPGIQALQVLNSRKQWIDAPPIEGTLVINLGDELARWTNDVFTSTVHRAINRSGVERFSIPLFFGTDYDVRLEPIPSCVSPDRPAKYETITAGEYIQGRLKATYGH
ncbi:Fe2OG dioxygenase domain-containing protein [Mycena indigotica]|uniref:Fe2OG dioxygenase domain-containing protein n=1 Tax=Mycena indigotica TaxID=2126181 RepID=A0A8H6T1C3_9AGAR|nr:Fe2OG dioxygenase domain-containing protein [Mycena indigotica]KAF7309246.1 Fe2OG dioxygenase domain-containing protein [Mycena indigotica]